MNDMYFVKKNVDRIYDGNCTDFLDIRMQDLVRRKIKIDYNIFSPFEESEKVIYYTLKEPKVVLYEIKSKEKLRHQEIMGSIFSLNLDETLFGDIVIDNDRYFVYLFESIENYFINNFTTVGNNKITLEKLDINYLKNYKRKYEEIEIISTSERIDTIVSRLTNINRKEITDKIKNEEIIVNASPIKNNSYILKKGDIFSIRRFGKYKYLGIIKTTKKDNLIVSIYKYI